MFAMDDSDDLYREAVQAIKHSSPAKLTAAFKKGKGLITLSSASSYSNAPLIDKILEKTPEDFLVLLDAATVDIGRKISHNVFFRVLQQCYKKGDMTKLQYLAGHLNQGGRFDFNQITPSDIRNLHEYYLRIYKEDRGWSISKVIEESMKVFNVLARNNPNPERTIGIILDGIDDSESFNSLLVHCSMLSSFYQIHKKSYLEELRNHPEARERIESAIFNLIHTKRTAWSGLFQVLGKSIGYELSDNIHEMISLYFDPEGRGYLAIPEWIIKQIDVPERINDVDVRISHIELLNGFDYSPNPSHEEHAKVFNLIERHDHSSVIAEMIQYFQLSDQVENNSNAQRGGKPSCIFDFFSMFDYNIPRPYELFISKSLLEAEHNDALTFLNAEHPESATNMAGTLILSGSSEIIMSAAKAVGGMDKKIDISIVINANNMGSEGNKTNGLAVKQIRASSFKEALTKLLDEFGEGNLRSSFMDALSRNICSKVEDSESEDSANTNNVFASIPTPSPSRRF